MVSVSTPIYWGVSWGLSHPLESAGLILLLKSPATRTWTLRMLAAGARGAVAGGRTAAIITYQELVVGTAVGRGLTTAATYTGAIAAGYVIGTVVGTGVAYAVWGPKGASQASGFYTGGVVGSEPNYWGTDEDPGYFNVPGNVSNIWRHYTS